jgi:hypothetical protein
LDKFNDHPPRPLKACLYAGLDFALHTKNYLLSVRELLRSLQICKRTFRGGLLIFVAWLLILKRGQSLRVNY